MKSVVPMMFAAALAAAAPQAQTLDTRASFDLQAHATDLQLQVRGPAFGQCWLMVAARLIPPIAIPPFGDFQLDPATVSTIGPFPLDAQGQFTAHFRHSWQQPYFALAMQAVTVDRFHRVALGEAISLTHNVAWALAATIPTKIEYKARGAGGFPIIKYDISVKRGDVVTIVRCRAGAADRVLSTVTAPVDGDLYGGVPNPDVAAGDTVKVKVNGVEVARTVIP